MSKKPFFSIVIPTYNRAKDLRFALYSILQQTFVNFEIIISDNSSTDNTKVIVDKFKDEKIRYFRNRQNIGAPANYQKAINHARGIYIFFHADDDFLLYRHSLQEIYHDIKKNNPGYVRVKYICRTPDKKTIFDFRILNYFSKNGRLLSHAEISKILSFIIDTDPYFFSGIIFKNTLNRNIRIIDCEPMPWIEILLYVTKNFGAYFISKPYIIASWSQWSKLKGAHPLYDVINGRLASENYFDAVRKVLSPDEYYPFLHKELMGVYVNLFPVIKIAIGNKRLLKLARKIESIDPSMKMDIYYWFYLIFAYIIPGQIIAIVKNTFFYFYVKSAKVTDRKILSRVKELENKHLD